MEISGIVSHIVEPSNSSSVLHRSVLGCARIQVQGELHMQLAVASYLIFDQTNERKSATGDGLQHSTQHFYACYQLYTVCTGQLIAALSGLN